MEIVKPSISFCPKPSTRPTVFAVRAFCVFYAGTPASTFVVFVILPNRAG